MRLLLALLLPLSISGRHMLQAPAPLPAPERTTADVLIIGAGLAGVAAARNLTDAGYSVIVLEARDRSGGRLHSVPTPFGRVDLGAMWIHDGFPGNPLYDLATALGLPLTQAQDYFSTTVFQPDGGLANETSFREVYTAWLDVLAQIDALRAAADDPATAGVGADMSAASLLDAQLAAHPEWTAEQMRQANTIFNTQLQVLLNANATDLSALRYGDAKTLPAIDVLFKDGFDSVVDSLKRGLDIRYGAAVGEVAQGAGGVSLTTAAGAVFSAPYAITTQPLGVLKEGLVRFDPELPPRKRAAIAQMGMGVLDKTILLFDRPFWSPTDFISREAADRSGLWTTWLNYNTTLRLPALVALNAGGTARALEAQADGEVVASLLRVLRAMYPGEGAVPEPRQALVTRWAADPWARGSYSYFAVGNPKNITGELAEPFGRLLFAGEATSETPATALGAYTSGLREAARAAALLGAPRAAPAG